MSIRNIVSGEALASHCCHQDSNQQALGTDILAQILLDDCLALARKMPVAGPAA
jgi:hypothetical protein